LAENIWNVSKTSGRNIIGGHYLGGNYWSDYSGKDQDRDGLGDSAYNTSDISDDHKDHLPLLSNEFPVINYTYSPMHPLVSQTIEFNATNSSDPDGEIEEYSWEFGDDDTAKGMVVNHQYAKPGKYMVNLTLTDNESAENRTSFKLMIYEKMPPFIIDFSPTGLVSDQINDTRTFSITTDQKVNVSWQIAGNEIQTNTSTTTAVYTNQSARAGTWNVSALVENGNGTAILTWEWHVTEFSIGPVGQFGGIGHCVAVEGDHAYLGQGTSFNVINISGNEERKLGSLALADIPKDIVVLDDLAYIAAGMAGLQIVDSSDPRDPELMGSYELTTSIMFGAWGVAVSGEYAYLASLDSGLVVVNVSDPASPDLVSTVPVATSDVYVLGNHLYAIDAGNSKLLIYNITDPEDPTELGNSSIAAAVAKLVVSEDYAYIAGGPEGGLQIIDVSDPEDPVNMSIYGEGELSIMDVLVHDDFAYIAEGAEGFSIVNVTDASDPVEAGSLDDVGTAKAVVVSHPQAFLVLQNDSVFQRIDISDPTDPAVQSELEEPAFLTNVFTSDSYLFICSLLKLWMYNNSDPTNPILESYYSGISNIHELFVQGQYLYALNKTHMLILDISDPKNISLEGSYEADEAPGKVHVLDDHAYLLRMSGLEIIDVSDPEKPYNMSYLGLPGTGTDIVVKAKGDHAHITYSSESDDDDSEDHGMVIVDVSNPNDPFIISTTQTAGEPTCLFVQDDLAFLGSVVEIAPLYFHHIEVFDIKDPYEPFRVTNTSGQGIITDIEVHDDMVLADIAGMSVHTWTYEPTKAVLIPGPVCHSTPESQRYLYNPPAMGDELSYRISSVTGMTKMALAPTDKGYAVYTSEIYFGLYVQELERNDTRRAILSLHGGSGEQYMCPRMENRNKTAINISLAVNEVADWSVQSLTFQAYGTGNDMKDIKVARLYRDEVNGTLLDTSTYSSDDGTISFDLNDITIYKGTTLKFAMEYEFNKWNASEPVKNFSAKININGVQAKAINCMNFEKRPDPKIYMNGGPITIGSVWNENTNKVYDTIQDAIYDTETLDGHSILVCPGTYTENVRVIKSLTIHSKKGREETIVQAYDPQKPVFSLITDDYYNANGTTIEGFTIMNSRYYGIDVSESEDCEIVNNRICLNEFGILLQSTERCKITNNEITENTNAGIWLYYSVQTDIMNNEIWLNEKDGILFNHTSERDGKNTTISGNLIYDNKENGIHLTWSSGVIIENSNSIQNNQLNGIKLDNSSDIVVEENDISHNNKNGIDLENSTDNVIEGNDILQNRENGISLEQSDKNIILNSNKINSNMKQGVYLRRSDYTFISNNNEILRNKEDGIYAKEANHTTISNDNILSWNGYSAIFLDRSSDTLIDNNRIEEQKVISGIMLRASNGNEITDNVIDSNENIGIYLNTSNENRIVDNAIKENGNNGIWLNQSNKNRIEDNEIMENTKHGIYLERSDENEIIDNMVNSNTEAGIRAENSKHNSIEGNILAENGESGVHFKGSGYNFIIGLNEIASNTEYGIHLEQSNINSIQDNVIRENVYSGIHLDNSNENEISTGNKINQNEMRGVYLTRSDRNTIAHDNEIMENGYRGIELVESNENKIMYNNKIGSNDYNGIRLSLSHKNTIGKNEIMESRIKEGTIIDEGEVHKVANGIYMEDSHENTITDNDIRRSEIHGISMVRSDHNVIEQNEILENEWSGMYILLSDENKISDNRLNSNAEQGIRLSGRKNVITQNEINDNRLGMWILDNENEITGNEISSNEYMGIKMNDAQSNVIRNNQINENKLLSGIWSESSHENEISNNVINSNGKAGVRLTKSNNNVIADNEVWYNCAGIKEENSKDNKIYGNSIWFNSCWTGIRLDNSSPEIIGNTISGDSGDGIHCENGSEPLIRYNNIYNNSGYDINNTDPSVDIDARYNWWGSPDGGEAEFNGSVDRSNMLPAETSGSDKTDMNGSSTTSFLDDSVVVEYTTNAPTSLNVLGFNVSPVSELEGALANFVVLMVNDAGSVDDMVVELYYRDETRARAANEDDLMPYWWDGSQWLKCSDWTLDTTDFGDFHGKLRIDLGTDSTPGIPDLENLLLGLTTEGRDVEPVEHSIAISINEVTEDIEPGQNITISGTVTVEPAANIESVRILLDGTEQKTITLANGQFSTSLLLPGDLGEGDHIITVNVTLETGEFAEKTSTISYTEPSGGDDDDDDEDDKSGGMLVVVGILVVAIVVVALMAFTGILPMGPRQTSPKKPTMFSLPREKAAGKPAAGEEPKTGEDLKPTEELRKDEDPETKQEGKTPPKGEPEEKLEEKERPETPETEDKEQPDTPEKPGEDDV